MPRYLLPARSGLLLGIALAATLAACAPESPDGIGLSVYAAMSLGDVMERLVPECGREAGVDLTLNLGASSQLARQIVAAHEADLFISADEDWMTHVADAGLVEESSRRVLVSNRLVAIVPRESGLSIGEAVDLGQAGVERISLAHPDAVPAGKYARLWLERAGVWETVRPRVVPAVDVRAALAAVEAGLVDAGVVYRTDAALSDRVRVEYIVPIDEAPPIAYPAAVMAGRPHVARARAVLACLAGPRARRVMERAGFVVVMPLGQGDDR